MPSSSRKTVYVTYIAATPEKVWQALTDRRNSPGNTFGTATSRSSRSSAALSRCAARTAGCNVQRQGDRLGRRRASLSVTWQRRMAGGIRASCRECLVTYEIAPAGEAVRLTMTESHSWDVPEAILSGGRTGWPAILSSLKSLLETGKPLVDPDGAAARR